jgi:thiol:disulfide interchange protein
MTAETMTTTNDLLIQTLVRLAINITVLYVIIGLLYSRFSGKKGNLFAFFLMGIMIFLLCILLKDVELQMGMALGLFAIFTIIRYRTRNMAIKDMAYLFTVIGISAINALIDYPNPVRGTIFINLTVILTIFLLEIAFKKVEKIRTENKNDIDKKVVKPELSAEELAIKAAKKERKEYKKAFPMQKHRVLYDNLKLLNPDQLDELKKDVSARTGINIEKIRIRNINLVAGNADLEVYYRIKK